MHTVSTSKCCMLYVLQLVGLTHGQSIQTAHHLPENYHFPSCLHLSVPYLHLVRCCKSSLSNADCVPDHFENVKLEPNPAYGEVTLSQAQTEPQPYKEFMAKGGVNSDNVAMEENPAYQAAEPQPYECVVGVTSSDIKMEENPAYQSVNTTVS